MKIINIEINGYKKLKKFKLDLSNNLNENTKGLNITFFVGENGSGKSSCLETLAIIFSKAIINQQIDFEFILEYQIKNSQNLENFVKLTNIKKNHTEYFLECETKSKKNNEYMKSKVIFSEMLDLHPGRILTLGSGPHNNFEDVMIKNPSDSLSEYIINNNDNENINYIIGSQEDTLFNPKALNFDTNSLVYILISALFFPPEIVSNQNFSEQNDSQKIFKKNLLYLKNQVSSFQEKGFSIEINELRKKHLENTIKNYSDSGESPKKFLTILDYVLSSLGADSVKNSNATSKYFFEATKLRDFFEEGKDKNNLTSLNILTTFMIAYRLGIIKNGLIYLKNENENDLFTHKMFSDGEWFWLCKIGLVILSQTSIENNFLIIFDEPDAFLNEGWIEDFIYSFDLFSKNSKGNYLKEHDYFIATHSTLMLTDAMQRQVYKFEKKENSLNCAEIPFSTFGADRGYISSKLFLENKRTGKFVDHKIEEVFDDKDPRLLKSLLEELGQGYDRFLIQELKMKIDNGRL